MACACVLSSVTFVQIWQHCWYKLLNTNHLNVVVKSLNFMSAMLILPDDVYHLHFYTTTSLEVYALKVQF